MENEVTAQTDRLEPRTPTELQAAARYLQANPEQDIQAALRWLRAHTTPRADLLRLKTRVRHQLRGLGVRAKRAKALTEDRPDSAPEEWAGNLRTLGAACTWLEERSISLAPWESDGLELHSGKGSCVLRGLAMAGHMPEVRWCLVCDKVAVEGSDQDGHQHGTRPEALALIDEVLTGYHQFSAQAGIRQQLVRMDGSLGAWLC